MTRVGVIGAGVAGMAAALEASEGGAKVKVYEASSQLPSPKSCWPSLLAGTEAAPSSRLAKTLEESAIETSFGQPVIGVDSARRLTVGGAKHEFDSLVLSTGSVAVPESLASGRRRGVHILASRKDFVNLREALVSYQHVSMCGSGLVAVDVSEKLRGLGLASRFSPPGVCYPPS